MLNPAGPKAKDELTFNLELKLAVPPAVNVPVPVTAVVPENDTEPDPVKVVVETPLNVAAPVFKICAEAVLPTGTCNELNCPIFAVTLPVGWAETSNIPLFKSIPKLVE
jgi:hypothetical protein